MDAEFTPREREVMQHLASGRNSTAPDISRALGIQPDSVRHHLMNAYDKLGVTTNVDAVVAWITGGYDEVTTLIVSEVFGPTVQGEGPSAGQRAAFVRLGRCNLDCAFCDTPYTWDWSGKNGVVYDPDALGTWDVDEVVSIVKKMIVGLVVITGGEPMLQRKGLTELVHALSVHAGVNRIEIETNGTQLPCPAMRPAQFNVSPKLASSGVERERAWNKEAIESFRDSGSAVFKFVIGTETDLREVAAFCAQFSIPSSRVWLMAASPFGEYAPELNAPDVAQYAIDRGWNFTDRLHVRLWGQERGR